MPNLVPKQRRFVEEYLKDPTNASAAAVRAGYHEGYARQGAHRILQMPHIKAEVQRVMDERGRRTAITLDRVIEEIARVAFATYTDLLTRDGRLDVDLTKADDGLLAGIAEISQDVLREGETFQIIRTRVKLHNKLEALSTLMKHLLLEAGKPTARVDTHETRNLNIKAWMDETAREIGLVQWERLSEDEKDKVQ